MASRPSGIQVSRRLAHTGVTKRLGRIPQSFIDDLMARTDIVEVVGSRVALKKAGREYAACCPFHNEKTPSFTVSPGKQFYHCFGCGAHGTALGFLMEHDHLSFPEAVEELARVAGMEVPREAGSAPDRGREDLYHITEQAADIYAAGLAQVPAARDYVRSRGLDDEMIARFRLGFAPDAWDTIVRRLGGSEQAERNLLRAGLASERESGGLYDRFRGRLMFPIRDVRGRVIGFGGRVLGEGEPKYLNSPETPLFHKGRELYGLYEARQVLRDIPRLLVVEGYMDVIGLHQAGIPWAVATLGTATTGDHANRLFRVTPEIVFCFDGDAAGRRAAWRALENVLGGLTEGRQVRFLFLPEGEDPDSLVAKEGAERFAARVDDAEPLSRFLLRRLAEQVDMSSLDGRARLAELARPLVRRVPDGVFRSLLLQQLAAAVGMAEDKLARLLARDGTVAARPDGSRRRRPAGAPNPRASLVRQAITLVLQYPTAAAEITVPEGLATLDRPGLPLLAALLEEARARPNITAGGLLERWREKTDYPHLAKLAAAESLTGEEVAAHVLQDTLDRLAAEAPEQRADELLAHARVRELTPAEKAELRELLGNKSTSGNRSDSSGSQS